VPFGGVSPNAELPAADLLAAKALPGLDRAIAEAGFTQAAADYAVFSSGSLSRQS
jgi:hypothetical protein